MVVDKYFETSVKNYNEIAGDYQRRINFWFLEENMHDFLNNY